MLRVLHEVGMKYLLCADGAPKVLDETLFLGRILELEHQCNSNLSFSAWLNVTL